VQLYTQLTGPLPQCLRNIYRPLPASELCHPVTCGGSDVHIDIVRQSQTDQRLRHSLGVL
jgi:hypothetical protein